MVIKRRIEITVETERIQLVRGEARARQESCPVCDGQVKMVTAESAALLCGQTLRWIVGQVEISALHFLETPDGLLFICLNSLLYLLRGEQLSSLTSQETQSGSGQELQLIKSLRRRERK